jgi:hypothetical protein
MLHNAPNSVAQRDDITTFEFKFHSHRRVEVNGCGHGVCSIICLPIMARA